ncbi:hypothetical protein S7335_238 [Synechococcus sp. PCC 7335]|nr:hypothetical protein S7335_238 [Synechococcus sp. PCC 7335]
MPLIAGILTQLIFGRRVLDIRPVIAQPSPAQLNSPYAPSPDFSQLQQSLERHGFTVNLALPPQPGSYGLLQASTRTIWINPVVFSLEISVPTLVHEAVHAAQLCSGTADTLRSLDLNLEPYAPAYRLYMRYTGTRRILEMEAYTIQARADRIEYVARLLNSRC